MDNRRAWLIALVCAGSTVACGSADTSFTSETRNDGGPGASGSGGMSSANGGSGGGAATGGRAVGGTSGAGGAVTGGATSSGGNAGAGGVSSGGVAGAGGANTGGVAGAGGANTGGVAGAGGANTGGIAGAGGANAGGIAGAGGANTGGIAGAGGANTGGVAGAGGANTGGIAGAGGANTGGIAGTGGVDGGTLGSFVSGTVGDNSNPGTPALPVQTIAQGITNAQALGGVPVYVAEGHYSEKVTLVEGIDLLGGYQCDTNSCTWVRDPIVNDTAILDQDAEGVLANDTITRATTIEGFRIMGQNGGTTGRGRASITLRGGSPTITNNRIFGANTTGGTGPSGRSIGILVLSPSNTIPGALIEGNTISAGQASDQSIGIAFESSGSGTTAATIRRNDIRGGSGVSSAAINAGNSSAATLVEDNDIRTGSATTNSAWAINLTSLMTIDGNRINVGNTTTACQPTNQNPCGGINSLSSTSTITNNVVFGVIGPRSIGVRLMEAEVPSGVVILNSNTINAGGTQSNSGPGSATTMSAALQVEIGACNSCGFNGFVGHIRNNILLGGVGDARFAIYEQAGSGRTQHPDILENNDLYVIAPLSANDALYRFFDGTNQTLITSITNVNGLQSSVARMTVGANISVAPGLDASFNLLTGSLCIDKGTSSEAPALDKNGLARPQNAIFDIGADEF